MARYIDAERLLEERRKEKYYHLPNGDIAIPIIDIENAPTEEVAPVIHAYWIERFDEYGKWLICSNCHQDQDYDKSTKFCPCCGAKMDKQT